jgi:hypothetical protein
MKDFHEYWSFLAIRGALAVVAAIVIAAMPFGAAWIMTIPVALALTADCLAAFAIFDGAVALVLNRLLPARATHRRALFAETAIGAAAATLLFFVVYGLIGLHALLWIVAAQFAAAAVVEYFVARDTHAQYHCLSCYTSSIALAFCALILPFASGLDAARITAALAGCVALYGLSQFAMGARMLFLEYRSVHPAPTLHHA